MTFLEVALEIHRVKRFALFSVSTTTLGWRKVKWLPPKLVVEVGENLCFETWSRAFSVTLWDSWLEVTLSFQEP